MKTTNPTKASTSILKSAMILTIIEINPYRKSIVFVIVKVNKFVSGTIGSNILKMYSIVSPIILKMVEDMNTAIEMNICIVEANVYTTYFMES